MFNIILGDGTKTLSCGDYIEYICDEACDVLEFIPAITVTPTHAGESLPLLFLFVSAKG